MVMLCAPLPAFDDLPQLEQRDALADTLFLPPVHSTGGTGGRFESFVLVQGRSDGTWGRFGVYEVKTGVYYRPSGPS